MNKNDYTIRLERKDNHAEVENLVREAFWNVYRPGCLEHYVIHQMRSDPAFEPELDFVMEQNGNIIGQNIFVRAVITADDGRKIPIMAKVDFLMPVNSAFAITDCRLLYKWR